MGLAMDGMASTVEVHMRAGDAALCVPPNHRWPIQPQPLQPLRSEALAQARALTRCAWMT